MRNRFLHRWFLPFNDTVLLISLADNTKKKLNMACQKIPIDLSLFAEQPGEGRKPVVSPQILLAAHRFLLAEVDPFKNLLDKVLLRLLKQDVVLALNAPDSEQKSDKVLIYKKNKASDYFVLILEVRNRWIFYFCSIIPMLSINQSNAFIFAAKLRKNNTIYTT